MSFSKMAKMAAPQLRARDCVALTLEWERVPAQPRFQGGTGALGPFYHLQSRRADDCEWGSLGKMQGNSFKVDTGIEPGTAYVFRVMPMGKEGEGWGWSPTSLQFVLAEASAGLPTSPCDMPAKELSAQFVREFSCIDTTKLIEYLEQCRAPFSPSLVYEVATEQKLLDENKRISMFRCITNPALFEICRNLLSELTASDPFNVFTLHENDVTEIVYSPGGKFGVHRDFLSLTSNVIEEYTLLVSTNRPGDIVEGGETRVAINKYTQLTSKATTTPGCALLMRKDLEHEGLVVTGGQKAIISLNVWCMRKSQPAAGVGAGAGAGGLQQIIHVTFPPRSAEAGGHCEAGEEDLQALTDRSYAIPVSFLDRDPNTHLTEFVQFENSKRGHGEPLAPVLSYCSTLFDYDAFKPVFLALSGGYVPLEDIVKRWESLDYFNIRCETFKPACLARQCWKRRA